MNTHPAAANIVTNPATPTHTPTASCACAATSPTTRTTIPRRNTRAPVITRRSRRRSKSTVCTNTGSSSRRARSISSSVCCSSLDSAIAGSFSRSQPVGIAPARFPGVGPDSWPARVAVAAGLVHRDGVFSRRRVPTPLVRTVRPPGVDPDHPIRVRACPDTRWTLDGWTPTRRHPDRADHARCTTGVPPDGEADGRDLQPGLRVLLLPVQGDAVPGQPVPDGAGPAGDLHPGTVGGARPGTRGGGGLAGRRADDDGPGLLPPLDRAATRLCPTGATDPEHDANQRHPADRRVGRVPEGERFPGRHLDRRAAGDARRLPG